MEVGDSEWKCPMCDVLGKNLIAEDYEETGKDHIVCECGHDEEVEA